jgi:hypothetical protein
VFLSTKDGPTPIAVARMVARLKRLVWRVPSGWARSRVDPRHDLHIRASWHYALNRDLLALALQQEGAGRVSRRSKGTRTYCRPAMMRRSIGFSAGTRRAPIRRRPRQGLDTQRRFRQRHTLHTGGGHRLNPCRAHRRARDCDRRVAQWQSTPTTWERSGVRSPFAPTMPSMKSPFRPRGAYDTRRPLAEAKFRPIWTKPCAIVNGFINMIASISRCQTAIRRFSDFPAASLPRLQFDRSVASKVLARRTFRCAASPAKIFSLSFPERQGKARGRAGVLSTPALRWRTLPAEGKRRGRCSRRVSASSKFIA